MKEGISQIIHCQNLKEWHNWLKENHLKESSVSIIINKKHTGKGTISHLDSMKEAICFGWIDTTIKRVDENQYQRNFRRRTDKSKWSDNTLRYAKELLAEGRMFPEGIKRYKEGLAKPTHDHGIPKDPEIPDYVKKEIEKQNLTSKLEKLPKSIKRMHFRMILSAKLPETKQKRVQNFIDFLKNRK